MNFVTARYALFFLVVFFAYWRLSRRNQNLFLLLASCVFYSAWDWRFLGLIFISIASNFVCGNKIAETFDPRLRKTWLWVSIAVNLGILFYFKYAVFFGQSFVALAHALGFSVNEVTLKILLPVGISFYVFHSLSYTIDIYRGDLKKTDSIVDFAAFVTFFPQMVAGPIVRARELLFQLHDERQFSWDQFQMGLCLFLNGLFLKAFVADNLALKLVDAVFASPSKYDTGTLWSALFGYSFQIYADFCGYSLMASGSALLLGIVLPTNFRHPYLATDFSDFWRRWHISMSRFFRDYVYISLGGNRGSRRRTLWNLAATNLLSGLWHGANWTFVAWGGQHAVLNAGNQIVREQALKLTPERRKTLHAVTIVPRWALVQIAIVLTWVVFRAANLPTALQYYHGLFNGQDGKAVPISMLLSFCFLAIVADHLHGFIKERRQGAAALEFYYPVAYLVMVLAVFNGTPSDNAPFIYFQF